MTSTHDIRHILAKAARILLVFALVFYTSLRVEVLVAYGAGLDSVTVDDGRQHSLGELADVLLYQRGVDEAGQTSWKLVAKASSAGRQTVELASDEGAQQFVAEPVWDASASFSVGSTKPSVSSASFITWEVPTGAASYVTAVAGKDSADQASDVARKNVLELAPVANTETPVVITAKNAMSESIAFTFEVAVAGFADGQDPGADEDKPPLLSSVDVLDSNGAEFGVAPQLKFSKKELPVEYRLQARVIAQDQKTQETSAYAWPGNAGLSTYKEGVFANMNLDDLEWSVSNGDIAEVSAEGVLRIKAEGEFTVSCTAYNRTADDVQIMTDEITVVAGKSSSDNPGGDAAEDPQGASHPQQSLLVTSTALPKQGTSGSGSASSSSSASASSGSSSSSAASAQADATGTQSKSSAASDASSASSNGEAASGKDTVTVRKEYRLTKEANDFKSLTSSRGAYKMNLDGKATDIDGEGVLLLDVLKDACKDAGVDLDTAPIESVDFVDYRGVSVNVPWSFIQSSSALVALNSYVHTSESANAAGKADTSSSAGEGGKTADGSSSTGSSESAAAAVDELTGSSLPDNTRFRILFNAASTSFNGNNLRWIKAIQLNGSKEQDDRLAVSIDYTPVPAGVNAEFVAVPINTISGSWNCSWERLSKDSPLPEKLENEIGQTLSVPTSESTVGNRYRVTIVNTAIGEDGKEVQLTAVSDWVELKALSDQGVVLSYNPPRAGDMAIFRTSIYGYKGDPTKLKYEWRYYQGSTYPSVIKGETKSTLRIPTDPVDESGSSSGDGGSAPAALIYIQVRVYTDDPGQKQYFDDPDTGMLSNMQPLTVHVGDEDGQPSAGGNGQDDPTQPPSDPTPPPSGGPSSGGVINVPPTTTITEIDNITMEYSDTPTQALDPQGSTTQSTPQHAGNPSQIYVNENVNEVVNEQQQEVQQKIESVVPGARWTSLNAVNPNDDDVRRVLDGNPLVPLVIPAGLGFLVAGGIEKFLFFRRQTM